jgi:fused signal recognition particle receptor
MAVLERLRTGLRRTAQQLGDRVDELLAKRNAELGTSCGGVETLDALEELLLEADVGITATDRIITRLQSCPVEPELTGSLRNELKNELLQVLKSARIPKPNGSRPRVVMLVGVNGTGKTTTVGKLAKLIRVRGERPLVCAADTFRAGAVEQVGVWAERAGVEIVKASDGADPASVVFDAVQAGRARGLDVVLIDTAGRLHTRVNLMGELKKICRVVAREIQGAPHEVLLVIDATVGQNGLAQAREFLEHSAVTGIVLTKLDGTAKGGIAVAIAAELGLPIRYVGIGEGVDDLLPFSAEDYVEGLFTNPTGW